MRGASSHSSSGNSVASLNWWLGLSSGLLLGSVAAGDDGTPGLAAACSILAVIGLLAYNRRRPENDRVAADRSALMTVINTVPHGLVLFDRSACIVVCNQPYIDMFGLSADVVKPGCSIHRLVAHRQETGSFEGDVDEFCNMLISNAALGKITRRIIRTPAGRAFELINTPLQQGGWVARVEDITKRIRADEKIVHMARHDGLTDLPNRTRFRERLEQALTGIRPGEQLAVMCIDIDGFKAINDTLGLQIGDELLRAVAGRLRACDVALAARFGGDEFAVVQTGIRSHGETVQLLAAIYEAIRAPIDCHDQIITIDASIDIATAPADGQDVDQLLRNADLALSSAKREGRRSHRFFESGMDTRARERRGLELALRQAIADGDFALHYQPLLNLADGRIRCCEALLRWTHAERGAISPAEFIPVAEETGLIKELGLWTLNTACREAANWPGDVAVAVNVSPVQFKSETLALNVIAVLAASGLAPSRLELEITEAVLIRDDQVALEVLRQLRAIGVRIALDDFGTGYSSLSYLQRFPFDKIKIDRTFIERLADADGSSKIVQAIVDIAAASDMTTTAEGVETEQQRDCLRTLGCTEMQGYLFSRPVPAREIRALLTSSGDEASSVA